MKCCAPRAIIFLFLLFVNVLQAQEKCEPQDLIVGEGSYKIFNESASTSVPFKDVDNHIVVQVHLNNKALNLVLDSGMPIHGAALLGSPGIDSLNLDYSETMPVGGVGGDDVIADVAMDETLDLPNLKLTDVMIIVLPYDESQHLRLQGRDGIIGFSIFEKFVIDIDYINHLLKLTKPEAYMYPAGAQTIPLEVRQNRIFVKGQIQLETGQNILADLVLDTGNRNALMLNTKSHDNLAVPSNSITFDVHGLSMKLERKAGRIRSVTVGNFTLSNVVAAFNEGNDGTAPPWEKEGNLGNGLLCRFDVTIDLLQKCIVLKPNSMFSDPFEFGMAGIQTEKTEDGCFTVDRVIPNSPAEKTGIRKGDIIIEIDNQSSGEWNKSELDSYLKRSGEVVRFKIDRAGKFLDVKLTLTRLI